MRPWTEADIRVLRADYPRLGGKHIASVTGRPVRTVWEKARYLGIRYSPEPVAPPPRIDRAAMQVASDTRRTLRRQIGEAIEADRQRRGLKVWAFAEHIGIPASNYRAMISGGRSVDAMLLYAARAGISITLQTERTE